MGFFKDFGKGIKTLFESEEEGKLSNEEKEELKKVEASETTYRAELEANMRETIKVKPKKEKAQKSEKKEETELER